MAFTESSIPDLTGRTAVVTGANGGLGLATAQALAGAGAHVVMATRNQKKAAGAHQGILAAHPGASLQIIKLDLASQASVKAAAVKVMASRPKIDILVHNAGIMATPQGRTVDGYESQFGVNHLGHWTFTAALLPGLLAADAARVVTVTSVARHWAPAVNRSYPEPEVDYRPWPAYGRSKLANFHFSWGLQREFDRAGVPARSLAAHPGFTDTDLLKTPATAPGRLTRLISMRPSIGARPQIRAAVDPGARGGELYAPRYGLFGPAVRRRYRTKGIEEAVAKLWRLSEERTGVGIDIDTANPAS